MKAPSIFAGAPVGVGRGAAINAGAIVTAAPAVVIVATALFLRLYAPWGHVTFYPDSYGQLRAASNLASLNFPVSYYYPPGIGLVLAPFFAVWPDSLATMQAAIMVAGLALIGLGYSWCRSASGDQRSGLICAFAVAIGTTFVFHSRIALFEVINTLLIGAAIWLAPGAARRGPLAAAAFGVLAFAMVTARYTNVVVLPALLAASLGWRDARPSLHDAITHMRSTPVLIAISVMATLGAIYLATSSASITRFGNAGYGSVIDWPGYLPRLLDYMRASLIGYSEQFSLSEAVAGGTLLALAVVGARRLWTRNRGLLVAIGYVVVVWGPAHAPYEVFFARYAMTPFFLLLLLASIGLPAVLDGWRRLDRPWQRASAAGALALTLTLFAGQQLAQDLRLFLEVSDSPAAASESAYEEIRVLLRDEEDTNAVLVSSQVLAVDRATGAMAAFDLSRHSSTYGINEDSIARFLAFVDGELEAGRAVYYHYTPYEEAGSRLHRYELGFDAYYEALGAGFTLRELGRASERPHRLYAVDR